MSTKTTKIEWTDKTWNPVTGCTKISQGCAHCYAEVMSRRLKHRYQLLTKRADRMAEYFLTHDVPQNAWLGVTVEA